MRKILVLLFALATSGLCQHPRIWMSPATLPDLRTRAAAGDPGWTPLRAQCDRYVSGNVHPPKTLVGRYDYYAPGSDYSKENAVDPHIGPGYQGGGGGKTNGYWDAVLNLGMCYQVTVSGPAQDLNAAANYLAKATNVLTVMSYRPASMLVNSGLKAGLTRYIYDTSFAAGTAWTSGTVVVDGAVASGSASIALRNLTPGGTLLAGDGFVVNQKSYIVKSGTVADSNGRATVVLGAVHARGSSVTNSTAAAALSDGTPLSHEIVVQSSRHDLKAGDSVTISGHSGNLNGTYTVTPINGDYGYALILNGSDNRGGTVQAPLPADALYNQGYGARFYGTAMAIGYDWLYDGLPEGLRSDLRDAMLRWVREAERNGYGQRHVAGNYYAGQSAAKLFAGLAIEQEDPRGADLYNEWYTNEWISLNRPYPLSDQLKTCASGTECLGIQPYFNKYLTDTSHPDGSNYGWLATQNYLWMVMAVHSAKGIDLTANPVPGFQWHEGVARSIMHQTRPNRTTFDTRTKIFNGTDPSRLGGDALFTVSYALRAFGSPLAPYFQSFLNTVRPALVAIPAFDARSAYNGKTYFNTFLTYDPNAAATDYTTMPLSFYEAGSGQFHARSDWSTSGLSSHFIAGPNVHSVEGGKDTRDRGSLVISRGDPNSADNKIVRLVTDAQYELVKIGKVVYADDRTVSENTPGIQNVFFVNSGARWRQGLYGPGNTAGCMQPNQSSLSRHNDGDSYTFARASNLQNNYYPVGYYTAYPGQSGACGGAKPFTSWTRDVLYVRPKLWFVYDRVRGITENSWDRYVGWHFSKTPVAVTPPSGMSRYDVAEGGIFKGAVFGIKPDNHTTTLVDVGDFGVAYRIEYRPPSRVSNHNFLQAFDAASAAQFVYSMVKRTATNADAVQVSDLNVVVAFANEDTAVLPITYNFDSTTPTVHYIAGLEPNQSYALSVSTSTVQLSPGSGVTADGAGVVKFGLNSGGGQGSTVVQLVATPSSLSFQCPIGGAAPPSQTVTLSSVPEPVDVQASASGTWLQASFPASPGPTPRDLTVTASCSGLSAGNYSGAIQITASGNVVNTPLSIAVQLTALDPQELTLNANALSFTVPVGGSAVPQSIQATRSSLGGLTVATGASWLSAAPVSASNVTVQNIDISVNASGLAIGTYESTITVTPFEGPAAAVSIPVTLTVTPAGETLGLQVQTTSHGALIRYRAPNAAGCTVEVCPTPDCLESGNPTPDGGGLASRMVVLEGLMPSASYFARATCGSLSQVGTMDTRSEAIPAVVNLPVSTRPPAHIAASSLVVEYGLTVDQMSSLAPVPCASGCSVTLPLQQDSIYWIRLLWRNSVNTTVARGAPKAILIP